MTIHIEDLTINAIIGILDFERIHAQQVVVNAEIEYAYEDGQYINYAMVVETITNLIEKRGYRLLEEALEDMGEVLREKYPKITSLSMKISKPNIIENATISLSKKWFNTK